MDGGVRNDSDDTHICDGGFVIDENFNRCSCWYCNWLSEYDGGILVWGIERDLDVGPLGWRDVAPPLPLLPPPPTDVGNEDDEHTDDAVDDDDDDDEDDEWFPILFL